MKPEDDNEYGLGCCESCGMNGQERAIPKGSDYCQDCLDSMKQMMELKSLTAQRNQLNRKISALKKATITQC